jgi:hypothetical protein
MKKGDSVWWWTGDSWREGKLSKRIKDNNVSVQDGAVLLLLSFSEIHVVNPGMTKPCNRCGKLTAVHHWNESLLCERCFGEHAN